MHPRRFLLRCKSPRYESSKPPNAHKALWRLLGTFFVLPHRGRHIPATTRAASIWQNNQLQSAPRRPGSNPCHIFHCRYCACCRCGLLTILYCACRAQAFDSQQRAVRCDTLTNDLLGVLLRSWRCVPRAHVVATAESLMPGSSTDVRECLCTYAHAPSRRPQRLCASSVRPRWTVR